MGYRNALRLFKERVLSQLRGRVDSIVLYGSAARGEYHRVSSDVDLLVIGKGDSTYDVLREIATDIDLKHSILISLVYLSEEEFKRFLRGGSPFIESILEEGEVLYDVGTFTRIRQSLVKASG